MQLTETGRNGDHRIADRHWMMKYKLKNQEPKQNPPHRFVLLLSSSSSKNVLIFFF